MAMRGLILSFLKAFQRSPTPAATASSPSPVAALSPEPAPTDELVEGEALVARTRALREMLTQVNQLAGRLPPDAKPLGLAARTLVEESLLACENAPVSAHKLMLDMERVSALAVAMRERMLLAPRARRASLPN
jgi:hypothetical protein